MRAKPQPYYNRICAINDRVIMRLQCMFQTVQMSSVKSESINAEEL